MSNGDTPIRLEPPRVAVVGSAAGFVYEGIRSAGTPEDFLIDLRLGDHEPSPKRTESEGAEGNGTSSRRREAVRS